MWYRTFEMIPLGPFHIGIWGLMVGAGMAAGLLLAARLARKRGIDEQQMWTLGMVVFVAAIVGSRVFWALQPAVIRGTLSDPVQLIAFWRPGLTLIGGLLAGLAAGLVFVRRRRMPVGLVTDVVATGIGLGIAVGRLGCFLTGLHPGRTTGLPWAIYFVGAYRHPIPLYESLLGLAMLALGLFLLRRRLAPGVTALSVALLYLWGRAMLDLLRAPSVPGADPRMFGGVTLTQTLAMVLGPIAIAFLLIRVRQAVVGR